MKVLYVADSSSWHISKWSEYFAERHEVHLFSDLKPEYKPVSWPGSVVRHEHLPVIRSRNRHLNKLLSIPAMVSRLRALVARERFEIVHATALYYAYITALARLDLPFIYTTQGSELILRARSSRFYRHMARTAIGAADVVTGDSAVILSAAREVGGGDHKLRLVQNGVDLRVFFQSEVGRSASRRSLGIGDDVFLILSPRALDPLYRIEDIIDAVALFRRGSSRKTLALFVYGFGDEREAELLERVHALGLEDSVRFVGYVDHIEMASFYRASDAVVSVPISDSSPRSVYEASACGAPVIVSDLPWVDENFSRGSLLRCSVGSPDEICAQLRWIEDNPEKARQLASDASAVVAKNLSYVASMAEFEAQMMELVSMARNERNK